jgi:hypothetical protein
MVRVGFKGRACDSDLGPAAAGLKSKSASKGNEAPFSKETPPKPEPTKAGQVRSGLFRFRFRFITRPKSRTMRATRQLMLPPSTVS